MMVVENRNRTAPSKLKRGNGTICPECGGFIISEGIYDVCSQCGLVVDYFEEKRYSLERTFFDKKKKGFISDEKDFRGPSGYFINYSELSFKDYRGDIVNPKIRQTFLRLYHVGRRIGATMNLEIRLENIKKIWPILYNKLCHYFPLRFRNGINFQTLFEDAIKFIKTLSKASDRNEYNLKGFFRGSGMVYTALLYYFYISIRKTQIENSLPLVSFADFKKPFKEAGFSSSVYSLKRFRKVNNMLRAFLKDKYNIDTESLLNYTERRNFGDIRIKKYFSLFQQDIKKIFSILKEDKELGIHLHHLGIPTFNYLDPLKNNLLLLKAMQIAIRPIITYLRVNNPSGVLWRKAIIATRLSAVMVGVYLKEKYPNYRSQKVNVVPFYFLRKVLKKLGISGYETFSSSSSRLLYLNSLDQKIKEEIKKCLMKANLPL